MLFCSPIFRSSELSLFPTCRNVPFLSPLSFIFVSEALSCSFESFCADFLLSWFRLFEFSIFIDGFLNQPIFGVFRVFPHSFPKYRRFEGSFLCLLRLKLPASFRLIQPLLYIIYVLTSYLNSTYNPAFFRLIFISLLILFSRLYFSEVKK